MTTPRATALAILLTAVAASAAATGPEPLQDTLAAQHLAVFDSFNRCDDPAQLERHARYFDADVEFYHDTGGVTWNRQDMLANTAAHACGKYIRQLVDGSLVVHPIPGFGAVTEGQHRFCSTDGTRCDGRASFTMVWRQDRDGWKITRVLSVGHLANDDTP